MDTLKSGQPPYNGQTVHPLLFIIRRFHCNYRLPVYITLLNLTPLNSDLTLCSLTVLLVKFVGAVLDSVTGVCIWETRKIAPT